MTDQKVIQAVIDKAVKNGWQGSKLFPHPKSIINWIFEKDETWGTFMTARGVETLIFDFSFAKALWEPKDGYANNSKMTACYNCNMLTMDTKPLWQFHLQQLVIAPNRIEYLKQFI